jgi:hypothetical protein
VNEIDMIQPCIICGKEATRYGVCTGRSWFDRIPFLSWISQLQAMPWRYSIAEEWSGQLKYCEAHRKNAESTLEQAHQALRAELAEFNLGQQQRITDLDHGELDQILRRSFDAMLVRLGLAGTIAATVTRPQLETTTTTKAIHVMPVATTGPEGAE